MPQKMRSWKTHAKCYDECRLRGDQERFLLPAVERLRLDLYNRFRGDQGRYAYPFPAGKSL